MDDKEDKEEDRPVVRLEPGVIYLSPKQAEMIAKMTGLSLEGLFFHGRPHFKPKEED